MADIDTRLRRYRCLKPPSFKEAELREYLIDQYGATADGRLPSVRALREHFGGGSTRILRIRRAVAAELGVRSSDELALRTRNVVSRLEYACDRLNKSVRNRSEPPADRGNVVSLPVRAPTGGSSDPLLRRIAVDLADVADRVRKNDYRSETDRTLAAIEDRLNQLQSTVDALAMRLVRPAPAAVTPTGVDASAATMLETIHDGQLALAQQLGDLRRQSAHHESRIDTLADRIETAAGAISSEAALARDAALERLETATKSLSDVASRGDELHAMVSETAAEAMQRVREDIRAHHVARERDFLATLDTHFTELKQEMSTVQSLDGRLERLHRRFAATQSEATAHASEAVTTAVADLRGQLTAIVSTIEKTAQAQRRTANRTAERLADRLCELGAAVEGLHRKRAPRHVRLHEESLAAIETAITRRLAKPPVKRRRKPVPADVMGRKRKVHTARPKSSKRAAKPAQLSGSAPTRSRRRTGSATVADRRRRGDARDNSVTNGRSKRAGRARGRTR